MEIIKGGFPARYGGRTSSVLDISMKEGNMKKFHGEGAVGILSAKMTFEGPIWKDHTSFIVSARRTYIDILAAPLIAMANKQDEYSNYRLGYFFYDLTAKINHKFSDRDRIYLSAYMGDDKFYSKEEYTSSINTHYSIYDSALKWGNLTAAFRWNHIFTNKLFANVTATYSRYRFLTGADESGSYTNIDMTLNPPQWVTTTEYYGMEYDSGIKDWSGKITLDYIPSPNHYIRTGGNLIYHTFNPGVLAYQEQTSITKYDDRRFCSFEYSAYLEDDIRLTRRLKANVGLHWSGFTVGDEFYNVWQPRVSARYLLTDRLSVKASYSRMAQYVHLLSNSNVGLPMDLWVPTTELLKPQQSDQVAIGFARNFREEYEISLEGYYKTMSHVMEYKEGATFFDVSSGWEHKVLQGEGRSYGMELFVQKKAGSFTGWVGYTLSWTDRQFDEINGGERFYYKYDRRHDISLVLVKRFGENIELSGTWVFGSGNCVSMPVGVYTAANPVTGNYRIYPVFGYKPNTRQRIYDYTRKSEYYDYGKRNSYRMAPYHRLDLSVSFIKKKKWGERRWIIGIYNAYCRKNPFYIDIAREIKAVDETVSQKYVYKQYSLFPIIPSVSYQFKF